MQQRAGAVVYAKDIERVGSFYLGCCGLKLAHAEDDHWLLESPALELVIVAIPASIAATISIATPPVRRQDTPIKLIFRVESLAAVRKLAPTFGGELNQPDQEWRFQGTTVCDGHDPEGNVVQFREGASERR